VATNARALRGETYFTSDLACEPPTVPKAAGMLIDARVNASYDARQ